MSLCWDCHMHTCFSGDSEASPKDMVKSAMERGLSGITFTDHLDYYYKETPHLFDLDIKGYLAMGERLKVDVNTSDFSLLQGMELGLTKKAFDEYHEILDANSFDFIIGSTHIVGDTDPYYPNYFEGKEEKAAYLAYYEQLYENIQGFDDFDTLGHIDYAFRYGPNKHYLENTYDDFAEIVDAILTFIIKKDIALEVNTAPLYKGGKMQNPCTKILMRYRRLGGELITIGADAHRPEFVASHFTELTTLLTELGFKEYAVFFHRKPTFYEI